MKDNTSIDTFYLVKHKIDKFCWPYFIETLNMWNFFQNSIKTVKEKSLNVKNVKKSRILIPSS